MQEMYYHFDTTQADLASLVQEEAERWGAACEVERDEDGTGLTIRATSAFRAAVLLVEQVRPLWPV